MTTRTAGWALTALVLVLLVPAVWTMGIAYGVETPVWDAALGTHAYAERPGATAVLLLTVTACVALTAAAIGAGVVAVRGVVRR